MYLNFTKNAPFTFRSVYICLLSLGEAVDIYSWTTYFQPFHWTVWLSIMILSIIASLVTWYTHKLSKGLSILNISEAFAISFASIFGITIRDANDSDTSTSARLSLFVIFICGSLFFHVYVGSLTSSLTVPSEYAPFHSPEGILKTNYR